MPNEAWMVQEIPHVPVDWGFLDDIGLKAKKLCPKEQVVENTMIVPIDTFYKRNTKQKSRNTLEEIKNNFHTEYHINNTTLVGIEVEVENITERPALGVWSCKEDGSLRNNGAEYVSTPMEAQYVPSTLTYLNSSLSRYNTPEWTSRTSIHVHINVQDMSFKQIQAFVVLYLCFESLLYKYAGNNRHKSIFCVPLSHAGYITALRNLLLSENTHSISFLSNFKHWHKYTGFNLRPIHDFGTIEFRHLSGTDNVEYISRWVSLILCLKEAACIYSMENLFKVIAELNTNSEYYIFASNIFKDNIQSFQNDNLQALMEKDVSHIKECFIINDKAKFDVASFETSYMYVRNKIQKIPSQPYDEYSSEELQSKLKEIHKVYLVSTDLVEKNTLTEEYKLINNVLNKRKLMREEL